jgi:hypothetical protein
MSLCIALHAYNLKTHQKQIVLCSDAQVGDDFSTSEATQKFDLDLGPGVVSLFSGTLDHAEDALAIYRDRLSKNPLTLAGYKEELYAGYAEFKDGLRRRGIKRTDVELIVAGFIQSEPRIIYISSRGVATVQSFVAIGSGSLLADAILRWRKPVQFLATNDALYYAYEAKKMGESSPHVGKNITSLNIIEEVDGGGFRSMSILGTGMQYLQKQFEKFGPQDYRGDRDSFPWGSLFTHRAC